MENMNFDPFAPVPFDTEAPPAAPMPVPAQPFAMQPQSPMPPMPPDSSAMPADPDGLYPEIYREIYPVITDAVNRMIAAGYTPSPDAIAGIVDNIIRNSGLWNEDEDNDDFDSDIEAIPVRFGFGRMPYRRRRRRYHNRSTLRDIVRILFLREMFAKGQGFRHPYY